jgi:predicted secreted Zn-dependent protease
MRSVACVLLFGACVGLAGEAVAGVKVSEKIRNYEIAGKNGVALLDAMDRHGPKHGFLTRAIAQTRYSVSWTIEWGETRTACRVKSIDGDLAIIYTYPSIAGKLSPDMARRWNKFLSGVRKHEKTHGALARQMAAAVERSVAKLTIRDDPGCRKSRGEVKGRMAAIYADYEARQIRFDAKEHREGGPVEGLIGALARRN